ncbi:MAG: potassium-transporting ATPase subunit KdpA [Myxococcota bacterium]
MTANGVVQVVLYLGLLTLLAIPLGRWIAKIYHGKPVFLERVLGPIERAIYKVSGAKRDDEMTWKRYVFAVLAFSVVGIVFLYVMMRAQAALPLNPARLGATTPEVAINTAVSFVTNTNWQAYGGESTMSYFTQMVGLAVQNFLSAGVAGAVLFALFRGFTREKSETVGSFWVDLTRFTLYVLIPVSVVAAIVMIVGGVVQTFDAPVVAHTLDGAQQTIPLGPVASQLAIKQLGTNGGGFFNANSSHPFENPNAFVNLVSLIGILLIPAALCFTFGDAVKDRRQGWAVFAAMMILFVPMVVACVAAEQAGSQPIHHLGGVDQVASALQAGGNMEGKEVRFGITNSGIWATATTAASNGSVNSMHDSFTPVGGLVPMWMIQLGEVVFGGIGCGLYGMLVFAIIAVFVAGLMVGRTPEYLGKKIEAFEMKMASLAVLVPCATILVGSAIAVSTSAGTETLWNHGPHGFSEILYAFTSGAGNNGSAFAGITVNTPFWASAIGLAMLIGRFWIMIPVLAIAGSLARKKIIPASAGTLPTHTPLFVGLLVGVVIIVGALTFVPALSLGPIVEHLQTASAAITPGATP